MSGCISTGASTPVRAGSIGNEDTAGVVDAKTTRCRNERHGNALRDLDDERSRELSPNDGTLDFRMGGDARDQWLRWIPDRRQGIDVQASENVTGRNIMRSKNFDATNSKERHASHDERSTCQMGEVSTMSATIPADQIPSLVDR